MAYSELLRGVLAHVEAQAALGNWDQTQWRKPTAYDYTETGDLNVCGTAFCFAGWTCELAGLQWVSDKSYSMGYDMLQWPEGGTKHVEDAARILLGLTWDEAGELFAGWNTLDDLRRIVAEITRRTDEHNAHLADMLAELLTVKTTTPVLELV